MTSLTIKVSNFTRFPSGRFKVNGPGSGEQFREEHLLPALQVNGQVIIDFEGVMAFPSSWSEEVFGGLVRQNGFTARELHKKLLLRTGRLDASEIWAHIEMAEAK